MSDGLDSGLKVSGNRTSELEDRSIESIQSEQQRNRLKKKSTTLQRPFGTITKDLTFVSSESQEVRRIVRLNNYSKE